jgi:hypothetical protein
VRDCRALSLILDARLSRTAPADLSVFVGRERALIARRFSDGTVAENGEQSLGERHRKPLEHEADDRGP